MVYVSGGQVVDSQSPWRLAIIPETFWSIINFIVLFFQTMVNPSKTSKGDQYTTDYRMGNSPRGPGGGGGGRPQRRMGGFRGGGGGPSAPPMAGGG